jgi:hypothetical protein
MTTQAAIAVASTASQERARVELTHHAVTLPGLPMELDGLRLVQLSDLHVGLLFRAGRVRRVVSLTNECRPDLVVLTGDFVSYRGTRFFRKAAPELAALRAPLGVFACLGNHDYWEGAAQVRAILEGAGVPVLVNESRCLADGLWLAAVDDMMSGEPDLARTIADVPDDDAVILISHNPTILSHVADRPWLVLSGHTHGGQVALPGLGPRGTAALRGIRGFMKLWERTGVWRHGGRPEAICGTRYPAGWYTEGRAIMYVSRGVGLNQMWPIRVNCPAEIACFTLRCALSTEREPGDAQ